MRRVRIEKAAGRRQPRWPDVLSLDPRDPDVVRAKHSGSGYGRRPSDRRDGDGR